MRQNAMNTNSLFLVLFLFFLGSCKSQDIEGNSTFLTENRPVFVHPEDVVLRTDSVLQFSVMITAIFEDSRGDFWFGSHGDGLCKFDGLKYTYFTANAGLPSGVIREFAPGPDWSKVRKIDGGNQIQSIQEDHNGVIWIKTKDGVCKLEEGRFERVEAADAGVLDLNLTEDEWSAFSNTLLFGSINGLGVYCYDGKQLSYFTFPPPFNSSKDAVSAFYKDHNEVLWMGTMDHGTFRYDGASLRCVNDPNEIGICRTVFQDASGRIWIGNNLFGLCYFEDGRLVNFTREYLQNNPELTEEEFKTGIQSIEQDSNGHLWFGTFGNGLWSYDGTKIKHYTAALAPELATSKTIYKDKSGRLLYGLGEGSVYVFNGTTFDRFDR